MRRGVRGDHLKDEDDQAVKCDGQLRFGGLDKLFGIERCGWRCSCEIALRDWTRRPGAKAAFG